MKTGMGGEQAACSHAGHFEASLRRHKEIMGGNVINKFHVLYVGQIELDKIGVNGTPANERRYSDERLREAFFTARDIAQTMDELGYDVLWTAEHHFQREGYEVFPNLIQLGLWLATQTKRLKFGCGFNVLPMWHPIRLAEDYAMADIVTDGRVVMGVGRGYHTREVESFGAPLIDANKNREIFDEGLELLLKCFNEPQFHHKGKFFEAPPPVDYRGYKLSDITMVPRPKHLPVEIWMPIASGKTIELMAKNGLKAMVTLNGEKILDDVLRAYQEACAKHGRPKKLGEDVIWGAGLYLADSEAEAMRKVEPAHDERYKWFAPFGFVRYADEQGRTWGTPGAPARTPNLADGVAQKAWFCGPPKHVIDGIKSIEAKYPGLEHFMIHWAEGLSPAEFKEQLRWFAKDVMPAFKNR
jgi:alkanesulfonate monooxygenase SsuD/methylene tetrahydromethanopterin reductase-like flavin-dependent oxidoreductase (luciferase family)